VQEIVFAFSKIKSLQSHVPHYINKFSDKVHWFGHLLSSKSNLPLRTANVIVVCSSILEMCEGKGTGQIVFEKGIL